MAAMFKKLLSIVASIGIAAVVCAQEAEFNADHPDTYVVVKGDTLWGIAKQFLKSPWLWPEVWQANPQIDNPHLIFPGDVISLTYVDGEPRLTLNRAERPTVKLSPHARVEPISSAIHTVPLRDIEAYLIKPRLLGEAERNSQPYVLSVQERRLGAVSPDHIYVRGLSGAPGEIFAIMRAGLVYKDVPAHFPLAYSKPRKVTAEEWSTNRWRTLGGEIAKLWKHSQWSYRDATETLGYEVIQIGQAKMVSSGDPATLKVQTNGREVKTGDLVMPLIESQFDLTFLPRSPDYVPSNTRIIAINEAVYGVGPNQVCVVNRGEANGLENGQVFEVFRPGEVIRDTVKYAVNDLRTTFSDEKAKVKLPDEYAAHVMIFRTFDRVSYALVLDGERPVQIHDILKLP